MEFSQRPLLNGNADVLLLAGDVCVADHFTRGENSPYRKLAAAYLDFFQECSDKYETVLYVMGNHEHYHGRFNDTAVILREQLARFDNVHLLERETFMVNGILVVGATLWTDMNNGCPITEHNLKLHMNDYHVVQLISESRYTKLYPQFTRREHHKTLEFFKNAFEGHEKVLVMTHHAPTFNSVDPKYRGAQYRYMNGGYASALENLMLDNPQVKVWVHGHIHYPSNYEVNEARVYCNPHGYPQEGLNCDDFIFEL